MDYKLYNKIIDKGIALLEKSGWCQDGLARDKDGWLVLYGDPKAKSFCAMGSMFAANPDHPSAVDAVWDMLDDWMLAKSKLVAGDSSMADFNDRQGRSKAEVIAKLRQFQAEMLHGQPSP